VADKLVTIAQFTDSAQASLAKQLLADFGIKSVLTGRNAANIYTIPTLATTSLQTFESQSKRAQEILESNKKQED